MPCFFRATRFIEFCLGGAFNLFFVLFNWFACLFFFTPRGSLNFASGARAKVIFFSGGAFQLVCMPFFVMRRSLSILSRRRVQKSFFFVGGAFQLVTCLFFCHATGFFEFCLVGA
ncbi:unnamed protein product [Pylaiella littoralis]